MAYFIFSIAPCMGIITTLPLARKLRLPSTKLVSGIARQAWMHVSARGRGEAEAEQNGVEDMTYYKGR